MSGALTVLSFDAASDAAGLFKKKLDTDGGSGFSFADLLADRAGTRSPSEPPATPRPPPGPSGSGPVAAGFRVDDFFPSADGPPQEGIPDAGLQSRYGAVGGPGYRVLQADIERRLNACPGYR